MSDSRPIVVTAHAIDQARRRYRDDRQLAVEIADEIVEQIKLCWAAGRIANNKPMPFRLYAEKNKRLKPGQRCVWTEDYERAWIVKSEPQEIVVLTSLSNPGFNGKKQPPSAAPRPIDP